MTVAEVALILPYIPTFPKVASKQKKKKMKIKRKNTMAYPYHSKVRSTQNIGVPIFSCLGYGIFGNGKKIF